MTDQTTYLPTSPDGPGKLPGPQPGWTLLPDGTEVKIMSDGQPLAIQRVPKGETPAERQRRDETRMAHVLAFWAEATDLGTERQKTTPIIANGNGRTAPRPRGAGRPRAKAGARSTSSGSGDDDPPEPPPSRRRLCAVCGGDLPADRKQYCSDRHADRARQRRKRARDRVARALPATDAR
jgi:hypothetical protein